MYHFAFYFLYCIFQRRPGGVFNAILGVSIIICLHILALALVLSHFNIIGPIPVFSRTYLYNKLAWYPAAGVVIGLVFLYYSKRTTKAIIEKYSAKDDFFTLNIVNILFFLALIVIPAIILAIFRQH